MSHIQFLHKKIKQIFLELKLHLLKNITFCCNKLFLFSYLKIQHIDSLKKRQNMLVLNLK